jgi:hypothetical protein
MNRLSLDTLDACLELFRSLNFSLTQPDGTLVPNGDVQLQRYRAAYQELLDAKQQHSLPRLQAAEA